MIDAAVTHIAQQLNQFLRRTFRLNEDVVTISNIMEQDGSLAPNVENKLLVFLTNIEKDTTPLRIPQNHRPGADRSPVRHPAVHLNLYLIFASHFSGSNYKEGLKFISKTIAFFQSHPVFDRTNSPDLNQGIEKLILDIENMNIKDLSSLWGVLSSHYLPSIMYRVRMLAYDAEELVGQESPLRHSEPAMLME